MGRAGRTRVGVRELRQGLSVYLRRIARGETFEVTEHGRPVALLAPLPTRGTPLEQLVAAGRATAPHGHLREVGPPRGGRSSRRVSTAVRDLRADRV